MESNQKHKYDPYYCSCSDCWNHPDAVERRQADELRLNYLRLAFLEDLEKDLEPGETLTKALRVMEKEFGGKSAWDVYGARGVGFDYFNLDTFLFDSEAYKLAACTERPKSETVTFVTCRYNRNHYFLKPKEGADPEIYGYSQPASNDPSRLIIVCAKCFKEKKLGKVLSCSVSG